MTCPLSTNLNSVPQSVQPAQPKGVKKPSVPALNLSPIFNLAIKNLREDLQELKQHYPAALAWLKCCADLDPTAIPEKVLTKWLSTQSNSNNAQNPKDMLRVLKRYNLISWDVAEGHLSLHRQMQEVLRAKIKTPPNLT